MTDAKSSVKKSTPAHGERTFHEVRDYPDLAEFAGAGFESFAHATDAVIKTIAALSEEWASFTTNQVAANLNAAQSILSSDSPAEALGRQVEFARSAGEAYLAETTKLFELAVKLSQDCWAPRSGEGAGLGARTKSSSR